MEYQNLIKDLSHTSEFYTQWFDSATETQKLMIWEAVWNQAAERHSENDFIQGLYEFYQIRGYLTHRQWQYLIRTIQPNVFKVTETKIQSLRDRIK